MLKQLVSCREGEGNELIEIRFKTFHIIYVDNFVDLIIADDPISLCYAWILKKINFKKTHLRFWMLEINEHQLPINSVTRLIRAYIFKVLSRISLKLADSVIFPSNLRLKHAVDAYGIKNINKCSVVWNIPIANVDSTNEESLFLGQMREIKKKYEIVAIYAGSLQPGRGLDDIFNKFSVQNIAALIVCGEDKYNLFDSCGAKLNNVYYFGSLSTSELFRLYKLCDVGLLSYENTPLNVKYCAPVKIWEYLSCGLKVLGNNNYALRNEWSDYVDGYYNLEDGEAFDDLLLRLKNTPLKNNRKFSFEAEKITSI
jgi:glycosyltransferase involved in cell wall biosynthesis